MSDGPTPFVLLARVTVKPGKLDEYMAIAGAVDAAAGSAVGGGVCLINMILESAASDDTLDLTLLADALPVLGPIPRTARATTAWGVIMPPTPMPRPTNKNASAPRTWPAPPRASWNS